MAQLKPWEIPDAPPSEASQLPWEIPDAEAPVGYGEDMAKGFGTGVAQGVIGIPGGVGTANEINQDLIEGAGDYLGAPEWLSSGVAKGARFLMPFGGLPGTKKLTEMVESVTGPLYEAKTVPGQYAQTMGQFVPGIALGPGSLGQKAASGVSSALVSETAGQATKGSAIEPYARLGGALVGGVAPDMARRAFTPFPVNQERQRLLGILDDEGIDLTAGQRTGRAGLKYAEAELGSGPANQVMERQGEQFTAAALARAGINANRATPQVIDEAFTRIGNQFDDLARRNNLAPDAQIATDVATAVTDYTALVPAAAQPNAVQQFANDLLGVAQNGLTGAQYQAFRSRLTTLARGSSDPQLRGVYQNFANALDDAMERSLAASGSPDLGAWQATRGQYRNMLVLEQAATGAGEKAAEGIISPSQLRNATVQKHGRRNYARGDGDFADLARAGEATMKPLPNSGTAGRLNAQQLGTGLTTLLGSLAGSGGGPYGMAIGGLLGLGAPMAAGRALMSRPVQAYLANQLFPGRGLPMGQRAVVPLLGVSPHLTGPR